MGDAVNWVFSVIASAVNWLDSWQYMGVSFLSWLIALAVIGIVLRYTL